MSTALATRPTRDVTAKSPNARTRAEFAKAIAKQYNSTVSQALEGFVGTGLMLETAKAELKHGEYGKMVANDLPFNRNTAYKLLAIATSNRVANDLHANHLPPHWDTVYQITLIPEPIYTAAVADGRIHPKMSRKEALALRPNKPGKPRKAKAPVVATPPVAGPPPPVPATPVIVSPGPIGPIDRCAMQVRDLIFDFATQMPSDQWPKLIADLRGELDDIDETLAQRRAETS